MAIDLREGGDDRGDDRGDGADRPRRGASGARVVVFHDNDRIWIANLSEVPALDVELDIDERASRDLLDLLAGLRSRTLSAYEQRCVPATKLPRDGVLLAVGWRDHLGGQHRSLQLLAPDRVTRLQIPDGLASVADIDRSDLGTPG